MSGQRAVHMQSAIENRRKQEDVYRQYDILATTDKRITLQANFENTTNSKIDRKNRQVSAFFQESKLFLPLFSDRI
jgi:hypothetical protein